MSRIDALIGEHCPDGVSDRPLGEVGEFIRGSGIQKKDLTDEGHPAIHYGEIHTHYGISATEPKSFVTSDLAAKSRRALTGDLIVATTSEDDEAVGKASAWLGDSEVAVSSDAVIYRHSLDPRFVSYYFQSDQFRQQKQRHITGTKVRRISPPSLAKLTIPVPPLEVQWEIVRILDNFTELEAELAAELEAELEARQKQYSHYRDSLLAQAAGNNFARLGDLAENLDRQRKPIKTDERVPGTYPYYGASGIVDYVHDYIFDGDFLLVSEDGANLLSRSTPIAFSISGKNWVNNHAHVLQFGSYAARRFVEIYLNSIDLAPHVSAGAQPKLNKRQLNEILVPDPPEAVKEQVVAILDQFDSLVNHLSVGLPAELAARRKQYEYYRDRLLTFEELSA